MKKDFSQDRPSAEQLEEELERITYRKTFSRTLRSTFFSLVVVAAVAVLVSVLFVPVLQIYGASMTPSLENGEIVLTVRGSGTAKRGEIIAFYYNNKILVKRIIGLPGDWVRIEEDGSVYVNDVLLDEPYVSEKALGECDLEFPYQVPDERLFVMGDHRATSVDSRSSVIGCVADEQLVGRILLRVWPFEKIGAVD